jgi:S1-C subfamily serine protease
LEGVFWATVAAVTSKTIVAARSLLTIAPDYIWMTSVTRSVPGSVVEFNEGERTFAPPVRGTSFMKYMAAVLLLVAAMSAQNAPSTSKSPDLDIPAIAREANGSVVSVVMSDKDGHPLAQGSGFVISKDGRIVTNYHVIKNGSSAVVKLPDGAFFAVDGVLASDQNRDVAIIKAHGNNFRSLSLGDSDRLQVGQQVIAIGSPLSLESTVSNGIISGFRTAEEEGGKFLQITVPISPGSSGGPLFNMAGKVVGITTSHLVGGENLNFAIPINDVKPLLLPRLSKTHALPDEPEPVTAEQTTGGSLAETFAWMQNTINDGSFQHTADCRFTADCSTDEKLSFSGCRLTDTVTHHDRKKPDWDFILEFDLKDIDPNSIVVKAEDLDGIMCGDKLCAPRPKVPTPILATVWFITTNDVKTVTVIGWGDEMSRGSFLLTEEYAPRFAKALTHAVKLCGGKPSTF